MSQQELPAASKLRTLTFESRERVLLRRTGIAETLIAAAREGRNSVQFQIKTLNQSEADLFIEVLECKGYALSWADDCMTITW